MRLALALVAATTLAAPALGVEPNAAHAGAHGRAPRRILRGMRTVLVCARACALLLLVAPSPARADDAADIRAEIGRQAAAWNRGDLDGYLSGYERAATTTMLGGKSPLRGFDAIAAMYRAKYGERARMGHLTFGDLEVRPLGAGFALAVGHWALARDASAGGPVGGWFSLTLHRTSDGWRIILDHTSS